MTKRRSDSKSVSSSPAGSGKKDKAESGVLDVAEQALFDKIVAAFDVSGDFADFEKNLMEASNKVCRQIIKKNSKK